MHLTRRSLRRVALGGGVLLAVTVMVKVMAPAVHYLFHWNEYTGGVRIGASLLESHQRAITSFAEQKGFGRSRFRHERFWNDMAVIFNGCEQAISAIQLLGCADTNAPVIYAGDEPPGKSELGRSSKRALTDEERAALRELLRGVPAVPYTVPASPVGMTMVMAPLKARGECASCHGVPKDTILGAFVYSLYDRGRAQ